MTLWLVRHAQPLVEPGICYGALDLAADATATSAAAIALAAQIPRSLPVRVSPSRRCQQLAQALQAHRVDLAFVTDARLVEMDFGVWEGRAWSDIPKAALDAWTDDFGTHRFGGRESANAVLERVAQAWDACELGRADAESCVWITHAGVIRAASLIAGGVRQVSRADQWPAASPAFGQWTTLA